MRWIRRGGVRVRTTFAATAIVAVLFTLGGAGMAVLLGYTLYEAAESSAEVRAEEIVAGFSTDAIATGVDDELEDVAWQVSVGDRVAASAGTGGMRLPLDGGLTDLGGDRYVVAVEPGDGYVVSVAASLDDAQESVAALVPLLAIGIPLAVVLVGVTTWMVTGRALRPVEQIRARVEEIEHAGLDARVPVPPSRDEIGRLASTMNDMLARLDEAARRQAQFVSDTSHELRSPLASLRQTAEVAQLHPGALEPGELATAVLEEAGRLQNLVDQMIVLTRTGEVASRVRHTEVDLDDVVFAEAARIRRLRPDLAVDVTGVSPVRVIGDGTALSQVVRNLADNAARHTATTIRMSLAAADGTAELVVADDGAGIPAAQRDRVFERFVRLDEARTRDEGGSGLGLAIVREVARAHGGDAVVAPSPQGARFVVTLPST